MSAPALDEVLRRLVAEVRSVLVGGLALSAWSAERRTWTSLSISSPKSARLPRPAQSAPGKLGAMDRSRLPTSLAGRIAAVAAAATVLALVLSQLLLPGIGEGAIEDRLTENGGAADVSLSAKSAARLLWGDGDRIAIRATGLDLEIARADDPVVFDELDSFGDVEIVIAHSTAGPVELENLVLSRSGDEPYSLEATGTTSLADLADSAGEDFDVPASDLLGALLGATRVGWLGPRR